MEIQPDKSKTQIIDAAVRLIDAGGIQALTIKNLSAELGATEAAIFRYFKNKTEVLNSVLDFLRQNSISHRNNSNELKLSENLVQQTRQNYETFFNTIDDFLFVLDNSGNIIHTNTTVIDRLGYSRDELFGKPMLYLHPPERRDEASCIFGEMLYGITNYCPIPLITKSGSQIPVESKITRGIWDGEPVIFGVSKDISRLEFSEEKFSKVFQLNPLVTGLTDLENRKYTEVNHAFYSLLGFDKDKNEVLGKTPWELGIIDKDKLNAIFQKADCHGRLIDAEADLKTKNGEIKHVLLSMEIINVQDKKYRLTIVQDITKRKTAERMLQDVIDKNPMSIQIADKDGFVIKVNKAHTQLFGALPPPDYTIFNDPQLKKSGFDYLLKRLRKGEMVRFPDSVYNPHLVVPDLPNMPIWLRAVSFPLNDSNNTPIQFVTIHENITESKLSELALIESEVKYRKLFDHASLGIAIAQDDLLQFVNPKSLEIFGYQKEEFLYKSFMNFIHPDDKEKAQKNYERRLKGEPSPSDYCFRIIRKDKTIRWVETSGVVFEWSGRISTLNFLSDITEKVQMDEGRQRWVNIFKNVQWGVAAVNVRGTRYELMNPAFAKMHGYTEDELYTKSIYDIFTPEAREDLHEQIKIVNEKGHHAFESMHIRKDGTVFPVLIDATAIKNESGDVLYRAFNVQDISIRKMAQQALQESEEKYRVLFENATQAILVAQGNHFRFVNPKASELTGFSHEEMLSIPIPEFIHPLDKEMVLNNYKKRLNGEPVPQNYQFRFFRKDKTYLWVELNAVLFKWMGENASLNFFSDITDTKRAEAELKKSIQQQQQLTKHIEEVRENERISISRELHDDLGQALTAVKIDLGNICQDLTDSVLTSRINKVSALVKDTIITVQRITARLRPQILDDLGLEAAIQWYTNEFKKRTLIEVLLEIDSGIVIPADASLIIFRILQESLTNITRHAKATRVDIKLGQKGGNIVFSISDNGIGITKTQIKSNDSFGIMGMIERTASLGGTFKISGKKGSGTRLRLNLPLIN
jgi:PAS domain S-box-containing protein